mmetsp:Transcript_102261/g.286720  ORF Transcript_102261/g.286720 Transcript_102261/m.286720 type:complete len:244 (+) Transcript_102261:548-1279(+)
MIGRPGTKNCDLVAEVLQGWLPLFCGGSGLRCFDLFARGVEAELQGLRERKARARRHLRVGLAEPRVGRGSKRSRQQFALLPTSLAATELNDHARQVVHGFARQGAPTNPRADGAKVSIRTTLLQFLGGHCNHLRVWKLALRDAVADEDQEVGGIGRDRGELWLRGDRVIFLRRSALLLVSRVAEGTAHREVAVHACDASHRSLDAAARALDALALGGEVGLVVRGQRAVGARARGDGAVRAA